MKQYNNLTIIFVLFALCSVLLAMPVNAQTKSPSQSLSVSPIIINVPLSPGKTFTKEITVQNLTDNPLPLRTNLSDFQTTGEEGGYVFTESKTNPLLSWISLSDTEIILNPKETKKIQMTIKTPKEIPLGGYYGMLFFQSVPQSTPDEVTHITSKIGILLLASIGVLDHNAKQAEILTYTIDLFHQTNHIPLLLRVKNASLHFFTAKPILTISPLFNYANTPDDKQYLEEKIVFQGNVRRWNQEVTLHDPIPNIYKANLVLSTGDGQNITQDTYFILLPSDKMALSLFIFIFILLLALWRKRLVRAIKILFSKNS